jgi:DNA-binding response OmpR family regulator
VDTTVPAPGPGRILLVEDDPAAARFAIYVLGERGGFDLTHVTDPVAAIAHIRAHAFDLVLADIDLPHMSGLDLLAAVRRIAPGLPVIMTTAGDMDAVDAHALLRSADAFLEKPISPRRLIAVAAALAGGGHPAARDGHSAEPSGDTP